MGPKNSRLQPQPDRERGMGRKEEMLDWMTLSSFTDLPPRGQEAFFRFLREDNYSEDQDIVDVNPDGEIALGMCQDSRRYQCWLKCQRTDLSGIFDVYMKQELTRLPQEFTQCFKEFKKRKEEEAVRQKEEEAVKQSQKRKEDVSVSQSQESREDKSSVSQSQERREDKSGSQSQERKEDKSSVSQSQESREDLVSVSQSQESREDLVSVSQSQESREEESSVSQPISKTQFLKEIKTAVDTVNDVLLKKMKDEAQLNLNQKFTQFRTKLQAECKKS